MLSKNSIRVRLFSSAGKYPLCTLWLDTPRFDRPVYPLYLVKHRVDRAFVANELCERDLRQSILDDLVEADDNRADAAITFVNARIEHARIAVAVLADDVGVEHLDDLAK